MRVTVYSSRLKSDGELVPRSVRIALGHIVEGWIEVSERLLSERFHDSSQPTKRYEIVVRGCTSTSTRASVEAELKRIFGGSVVADSVRVSFE